ncbi:MAG TPA: hypothetical protein VE439_02145 [Anaerolineae bacterium]|nr:hypothetical protein [Anaerolineae bacterium]
MIKKGGRSGLYTLHGDEADLRGNKLNVYSVPSFAIIVVKGIPNLSMGMCSQTVEEDLT